MKKLRPKMIILGILVIILTSAIPNILWMIFGEGERPEDVRPIAILIGGTITISISIGLFSVLMNKLIVKRVKNLDSAIKKVIEGNYNITLNDQYKDEIGDLVNNVNLMAQSLNQNEYMNKSFARNFSHEMKTPLSVIQGYADLLSDQNLKEEERLEYSQIISKETKRLATLSKNMLLISQLDHQVVVPKQDTFNIAELLRNVIQTQQMMWEHKKITLNIEIEDVMITSNKELMYQIFENLINNAIKFTEPHHTITMTLKKEESIYFSISNPGHLTEAEQKNIFQLFYIKDDQRSSQSSGVGLTLTKKMVEKLEGKINVTSNTNHVTFDVII